MVLMVTPLPRRLLSLVCALALWGAPVAAQEAPKVAGSDVPAPRRTKTVLPEYPPDAQAQGIRGIVILDIVIDTEGRVASADVLRSIPALDDAALTAVRQWRYEVTKVDGKPVSVRLTVPITFTIRPPEVSREKGIPPLQQGVPPAYPAEVADRSATVIAQVALDATGAVVDALVTSGDSPWADSVLRAVRTWRFTVEQPARTLAFKLEARFVARSNGASPRVELRLSDAREGPASAGAAAPPPGPTPAAEPPPQATPPTPEPVPTKAAPEPEPTKATPGAEPAARPEAEPAPGATAAQPTPSAAQPPVEMIPAPPPPPPMSEPARAPENGVSSIRDVTLLEGIPDLVKGRHPVPPPLARINRVTGSATVRFAVNAAGITAIEEVQGAELLKPAAQDTVASWTFRRTSAQRLHLVASFEYGDDTASATVRVEEAPPPPQPPAP
jgi:TonB family protein